MKGIGQWFQNIAFKISSGFRHFMRGRYGGDKLNITLVWISFAIFLISLFVPYQPVKLMMMLIYYGLLGLSLFRMLSRNTYKRYQENRKYLRLLERLRDRKHKHFDCPRCHQPVRVPRGKGKIMITCPKCKEKFPGRS